MDRFPDFRIVVFNRHLKVTRGGIAISIRNHIGKADCLLVYPILVLQRIMLLNSVSPLDIGKLSGENERIALQNAELLPLNNVDQPFGIIR